MIMRRVSSKALVFVSLSVLFASIAAVAAFGLARFLSHTNTAVGTSPLFVEEKYLNFGEQWETNSFVWVVPIENRSGQDVAIDEFVLSCSCTSVEPASLFLPAGQRRKWSLTLDLSPKRSSDSIGKNILLTFRSLQKLHSRRISCGIGLLRELVRRALHLEKPALDVGIL